MEFLLSKRSDRDTESLEKFVKGAVYDFIEKVESFNESVLSNEVKQNVVEKLNQITVLPGLFATNFSEKNLEDYYEELELKGDEDLVQSALEIRKFNKKINNDYKDHFTEGSKSWLDSAAQADLISYNTLSDKLSKFCIENE